MTAYPPYTRIIGATLRLMLAVALMSNVLSSVISIAAEVEVRRLRVEIRNSEDAPMKGIRVKTRGHSELSPLSTEMGLTDLLLPPGLGPGDSVQIELEPGTKLAHEWVFLQPLDAHIILPKAKRFYEIKLIRRAHLETMLARARGTRSENIQRNIVEVSTD